MPIDHKQKRKGLTVESIKKSDLIILAKSKPEWANFLAIDKDGDLYWFEFEPRKRKSDGVWRSKVANGKASYMGEYKKSQPVKPMLWKAHCLCEIVISRGRFYECTCEVAK